MFGSLGAPRSLRITFRDRDCTTSGELLVTPMGPRLYRLEEPPFLWLDGIVARDVIEADEAADGSLLFRQVVSHSGLQRLLDCFSKSTIDHPRFKRLCEMILRAGGSWSIDMGGVAVFDLPPQAVPSVQKVLRDLGRELAGS